MPLLNALLGWRPKTPFYYGWLIVAMAALGTYASTGLAQPVMGGIQDFILEDMRWNRSVIALAVTIGTWLSGFTTPFVGRLADRYGPRWLMPFGLIVVGLSFIAINGMNSVWQFYVAYIIGRTISMPILVGVVPSTSAVNFFQRRRNIALSFASMARPISAAINIHIISAFAVTYGWRMAYRYLSVVSFLLTLPLIVIMRRRPEDIGLVPDGNQSSGVGDCHQTSGNEGSLHSNSDLSDEYSWTVSQALRTKAFWLVTMSSTVAVLSQSAVEFNLVPYLHDEANIPVAQAAGVLSVSNFMALASLGWGYIANVLTPRRCMVGALTIAGGMVAYLFVVDSLATAYLFGVVWGASSLGVTLLGLMVLAEYFGRGSYGAISGTVAPFIIAALGIGPLLGGVAHDLTGSHNGLHMAMVGTNLLAAFLIFIARRPTGPNQSGHGSPLEVISE